MDLLVKFTRKTRKRLDDLCRRVIGQDGGYFNKSLRLIEVPLPIDPAMFPTWPAKSELGTRRALASSPKPPSGGDQFKALGEGEGADAYWGERASLLDTRHIPMGAGFSLKF